MNIYFISIFLFFLINSNIALFNFVYLLTIMGFFPHTFLRLASFYGGIQLYSSYALSCVCR
jgi:UPF0716 family protein affecting phage T7 exclusion